MNVFTSASARLLTSCTPYETCYARSGGVSSGVARSGAAGVGAGEGVGAAQGIGGTRSYAFLTACHKQIALGGPTLDDYPSPLTSELRL